MSKQAFYFSEGPYLRSMQSLYYALMNSETFIQFMGAPGSGTTSLCDKLGLYMERKGHEVFFIDRPLDSPEMLRALLAEKFKLPSSHNFARLLEDSLAQGEQKTSVLIFDDAHLLSDITLIEIHRLSEIQANAKRLLNIVLCGDLQLDKRLGSKSEFKSLTLNVSHKFLLEPMGLDDVALFLDQYLKSKGVAEAPISAAALGLVHQTTKGFPGPVTMVAELIAQTRAGASVATELGKEELSRLIKASTIQAALPSSQIFDVGQLKVIAPIAAVFAIAALGFLFQSVFEGSDTPSAEINPVIAVAEPVAESELIDSPFADQEPETSVEESIDNAAPPETPTIAVIESDAASAVAANVQVMPQLLRPAPSFSLDDEEPISDSSLSLVTAAEIGIAGELLQVPEYAELLAIDAEQSESTDAANDAPVSPETTEAVAIAETKAAELVPLVEDQSAAVAAPAQQEPVVNNDLQVANTTSGSAVDAEIADEPEELIEQVIVPDDEADIADATVAPVAEESVTAEPEELAASMDVTESEVAITAQIPDPVTESVANTYRESVDDWLDAWARQDMDGYFASYDESFVPRYDDNLRIWRRNRTRVITNAGSIKLNMSEFTVITETSDAVEVNFWLDYESPTYSDSTLKKLVLSKGSDRWLIVEEVNLQVRS